MAGQPPMNQPYGQPYQPMPQFAPPMAKRPGSVAPKVWGIILLVLGLLGGLGVLMNIASMGGGMSGAEFSNVSPASKAEIEKLTQDLISESKGRWSFWLYNALEVVTVCLSVVAGIFLVVKPKPLGRKLAIARALVVFVLVPVYGYETSQALEGVGAMQERVIATSTDDQLAERERRDPSKDPAEKQRRRDEMERTMNSMQPVMRGAMMGTMIVMSIGMLVLNSVLLFFMTRPAVKEYLEGVAAGVQDVIPGYDPSMGLASGPPQPPGGH